MTATAANDQQLPSAIDALADKIRSSLDFSSSQIKELKAQAFKPTSQSIEALRDYEQGLEQLRTGRNLDANKSFTAAINADPQFALGYSALAQTQAALGHQADAEQASRRASELANSGSLPQLEKDLIDASRATILDDSKKAISLYETLAQAMPGNVDMDMRIGRSLHRQRRLYQGTGAVREDTSADPKNVMALWQSGVVEFLQRSSPGGSRTAQQGRLPDRRQPGAARDDPAIDGHRLQPPA